MAATRRAIGVAFFDIDDTLVSFKTMNDFLPYYLLEHGFTEAACTAILRDIVATAERPGRGAANTAYFKHFAGASIAAVADIGQRWFDGRVTDPSFFHSASIQAFRSHQQLGHHVVFVSGSFAALLDPIAAFLGCSAVHSTSLATSGGRYTGEIARSMLGVAKADAVLNTLSTLPRSTSSWAYGDHVSDVGMLKAVQKAVVVGSDNDLLTVARRQGWSALSARGTVIQLD